MSQFTKKPAYKKGIHTITRMSKVCVEVSAPYAGESTYYYALMSDVHFDNAHTNLKMFTDDLKKVQDRQGLAFIFGDFFCMMQGKQDRRSSKSAIRPEHMTGSYLTDVVGSAEDLLMPYLDSIAMISDGNHETSLVNRYEFDPIKTLCGNFMRRGMHLEHMPYCGWVWLRYEHKSGGAIRKQKLFYHHEFYSGTITKGALSVNRSAAMAYDADIFVSGHTHDKFIIPHGTYRLMDNGEQIIQTQMHVKAGTYKDEFSDGSGFAVEKVKQPKPLGSVELELTVNKDGFRKKTSITV